MTRVLLGAAEAADVTFPQAQRAEIACAMADKFSDAAAECSTVRRLHVSVFDANLTT